MPIAMNGWSLIKLLDALSALLPFLMNASLTSFALSLNWPARSPPTSTKWRTLDLSESILASTVPFFCIVSSRVLVSEQALDEQHACPFRCSAAWRCRTVQRGQGVRRGRDVRLDLHGVLPSCAHAPRTSPHARLTDAFCPGPRR